MPDYPAGSNPAQKLINHTAGLKLRLEPEPQRRNHQRCPYKTGVTGLRQDPILECGRLFLAA